MMLGSMMPSGYALVFNGTDTIVRMGNNLSFERTDPFSISFWMKSNGAVAASLVNKTAGYPTGQGYNVGPQANGSNYGELVNNYTVNESHAFSSVTGSIVDSRWHHCVWVNSGSGNSSGMSYYVDGVLLSKTGTVDTLAASILNSGEFAWGAYNSSPIAFPFAGRSCNLAVYNKALDQSEVTTIFSAKRFVNLASVGPTANLVGYWPIKVGDTTSTIVDSSSGAHNGTVSGTASIEPVYPGSLEPSIGASLVLDGVNEYAPAGTGYNPNRTDSFSIGFWFKITSAISGHPISKQTSTGTVGWYTYFDVGKFRFGIQNTVTADYVDISTNATWSDSIWHFAVATYSGTSIASGIALYIDGVAQSTTIIGASVSGDTTTATDITLGARPGPAGYFAGSLSQIAIWNKALSAGEVITIYNSRRFADFQVVGPTANLARYWPIKTSDTTTSIVEMVAASNGTPTNIEQTDFVPMYQSLI